MKSVYEYEHKTNELNSPLTNEFWYIRNSEQQVPPIVCLLLIELKSKCMSAYQIKDALSLRHTFSLIGIGKLVCFVNHMIKIGCLSLQIQDMSRRMLKN